jgi:ABC-type antimicrobial peptide transport system permease subunit
MNVPPTEIPLRVTLTAFISGVLLALVAAWIPAIRVRRLEVREALGRVA